MITQPRDLHAEMLTQNKISSVKCLRLVSKEFGRLALTAIRSCKFYVGAGGTSPSADELGENEVFPSTHQLVKMFARKAEGVALLLEQMECILIIATGGMDDAWWFENEEHVRSYLLHVKVKHKQGRKDGFIGLHMLIVSASPTLAFEHSFESPSIGWSR